MKNWIIIIVVALIAYFVGFSNANQNAKTNTTSLQVNQNTFAAQLSQNWLNSSQSVRAASCNSVFESLEKNFAVSPSSFGTRMATYMAECPQYFGSADVTVDLGFFGTTSHKLSCQLLPDWSVDKSGTTTYLPATIDCKALTEVFAFTQNNQPGTLACAENNTDCSFTPQGNFNAPPTNEPQNFTTSIDGKHGLNCTPYDVNSEENANLEKVIKALPNTHPTFAPFYKWNCQAY